MIRYDSERKAANVSLANLNPVSKFIWLLSYSLSIYMIKEIFILMVIFGCTLLILPMIGITMEDMKRNILYLMEIQLITSAISVYAWYDPNDAPLLYTIPLNWPILNGFLPITRKGLYYSIRTTLLLSTVLISSVIFVTTTEPIEFAASLNSQLKISARISQCLVIGLNLIPMIKQETKDILAAQTARGEFVYGNSKRKVNVKRTIKSALSFFTTLIINILRKVDCLSVSLDKRGLGLYKTRTEKQTKWRVWDSFIVGISIFFPILVIIFNMRLYNISVPSVYSTLEQMNVISWIYNHQWVFLLYVFVILISILLFIFSQKNRLSKMQTGIGKETKSNFMKNNITQEKIDETIKIIESIGQKVDTSVLNSTI